jgi:hypothetical protein
VKKGETHTETEFPSIYNKKPEETEKTPNFSTYQRGIHTMEEHRNKVIQFTTPGNIVSA